MAAVLHGAIAPDAPADEQDVLHEVAAVRAALEAQGWRTQAVPLTLDLDAARTRLQALHPDVVVNLVEAVEGSGRWIGLGPQLLEGLHLPYTGAGLDALLRTSCKPMAKTVLLAAGLPTAPWRDAAGTVQGLAQPTWQASARGRMPGRWIVKSAWEHASIGIEDDSVGPTARLPGVLAARQARHGGEWFAEAYLPGREFNIALLGRPEGGVDLLPPAEIRFIGFPAGKPRILNYASKWAPDAMEYHATRRSLDFAPADAPLLERLRTIALQAWAVFGLMGYARVDFRVDRHGQPWVLEVNANPGLAPDAGFVAGAARMGLDYPALVGRIVAEALGRRNRRTPVLPRAAGH